jgi:ABC-type transport system substrate-binding protein
MRGAVLAIIAALAALLLAAAGSPRGVKEGGTFRVGIPSELFDTADAAISAYPGTIPVRQATCAGLLRNPDKPLPEGSRLLPDLATSFPKVTDGGRTYTFTLRRGVRFSTGGVVTSADVAHTINRALHPALKAYVASFLDDIVGAHAVLAGKAKTASGVRASGDTITVRLTKPVGDFPARIAYAVCVVPKTLPADPEGAKAPIPAAGPYFISEYVPGRRVVLERNRFYRGPRPHHVDRVVVDLTGDAASILDAVVRGDLDYGWVPESDYGERSVEFKRRFGLNRGRFFTVPAGFLRYFSLNTSRPLFRNNVRLRRAVNFAVDRPALLRERGPLAGVVTDQYLPPRSPAFRNEAIYPLTRPDLKTARNLAKGSTRTGKAVLYAPANGLGRAQAEIVKTNLAKIGLAVSVKALPVSLYFDRLGTPGEPYDIAWNGWLPDLPDPSLLNDLFSSENIPGSNFSRFASAKYDRQFDQVSKLTGAARERAYGRLDVDLARNAAPAIPYAHDITPTLVSARTGCVVVNPYLDLAAVCLK